MFAGILWKLICDDVHDFEFDENFEVITPFPLHEMPTDVIDDLSTDQAYAYRIVKMITTGVIDHDLIKLKIGNVNHSRWLTTGNRYCRLWISKHGLRGDNLKKLRVIIIFLVGDYFFMWFVIKSSPRITSGPHHKLHEIRLVQAMKGKDERSKEVKDLVKKFVAKGAWPHIWSTFSAF